MSGDTQSIGIAYRDQNLTGSTLTGCTLVNPTGVSSLATLDVSGATTLSTVAVSGASTTAPPSTVTSTSAATGSVDSIGFSVVETFTGVGGTGWAGKFDLEANVALGGYANAIYGYFAFGASGRITGLASATVGEIVLSAACTQGTYACFEAELGMPSGAKTGTATSFAYLSLYGADASTFDTNGFFFQVAGLTKNTGKCWADTTTGSTARPATVLRVLVGGTTYYLPLYTTVAIGA